MVNRIERSQTPGPIAAAFGIVVLLYLIWPRSNGFQGEWVGIARVPLLGTEMVTTTIKGSTFTMTGKKNKPMTGTIEILNDREARLTAHVDDGRNSTTKPDYVGIGEVRLIDSQRMEITFQAGLLQVSLNKSK